MPLQYPAASIDCGVLIVLRAKAADTKIYKKYLAPVFSTAFRYGIKTGFPNDRSPLPVGHDQYR